MKVRSVCILAVLVLLNACTRATSTSEPEPEPEAVTPVRDDRAAVTAPEGLRSYDGRGEGIPLTARYPDGMTAQSTASSEGAAVYFRFSPREDALANAEVHVYLPTGAATAADQEPFVTGPNGLIANNGWAVVGRSATATAQFPYPWIDTVIDFHAPGGQSGHVLLGNAHGHAVQVTLLYPDSLPDAYWSSARTVLDTLAILDPSTARRPEHDADASTNAGLGGTSWSLVEIASMDDSVHRPAEGARYELTFQLDGSVLVQADCNRGQGAWTTEPPSGLAFGPIATTRMACPPGSMDARFLSELGYVRSYTMSNGHLFLATMADGSILEFRPLATDSSRSIPPN